MPLSQFGEQVIVVNRVRDAAGNPVPYDAHIDGDVITINDRVSLPSGIARIIVQHSMYAMDPTTRRGEYKLGVEGWPEAPIEPVHEQVVLERIELIERDKLPPDRRYGWVSQDGRKFMAVRTGIPPSARHDSIAINAPGPRQDGAHPGSFGDAFIKA